MIKEFNLRILLDILNLSRSTYYYHLKRLAQKDKDSDLKETIQDIYTEHKGRYGYRRVHLELKNRGLHVNHKKVQRLMTELGLKARIRAKRRYNSYKGEIGKKADNLIKRQFKATQPLQKCYTDVTEFSIPASDQKLYLSPVLDGYNSDIIAYNLSVSSSDVGLQKPDLALFRYALDQAGVLARDAVYIGDRVDNYIIPAKTLGMTAIRIHQGLAASSPDDRLYPSDVHISKLSDLLEYF